MLRRFAAGEAAALGEACIARARATGGYMAVRMPDPVQVSPGAIATINHRIRGLAAQSLPALEDEHVICQDDGPRGVDWHGLERWDGRPFRWSGPNPRPRLLLAVTAEGPVEIAVEVVCAVPGFLDRVRVSLDGVERPWRCRIGADGRTWLTLAGELRADGPSVLGFAGPTEVAAVLAGNGDERRVGIAVGDIAVRRMAGTAPS